MKNLKNLMLILIAVLCIGCDKEVDRMPTMEVKHGMQVGTDSLEIGGKIFYVDTVNKFCLVALVSEKTQFKVDCMYPSWCPYYHFNGEEIYRYISGLTDTIGGGKRNTQILFSEFGCGDNADCNHNEGFYGAWCAVTFVFDTILNGGQHIMYPDYWAANLQELIAYSNVGGDPNWYMTSSQVDVNNVYTVNCRDKRTIIEPKSQKRLPLLVRKHKFGE